MAEIMKAITKTRIQASRPANASANTGYFVVAGGQQEISGGTSASAPLWAALVARMNQQLAAAGGKRVGYLTPLLYGAASGGGGPLGKVGCNDIAAGDNVTAHVGGFKSTSGFDAVTGWGSPRGKDLLAALARAQSGSHRGTDAFERRVPQTCSRL